MESQQNLNLELNEQILQFLLEYRVKHPEFTFATRVKNLKNRLDEGFWFLGQGGYIFVGFYRMGDGRNKTKTIGFVITLKDNKVDKNYIEIVYPTDEEEIFVEIHKEIQEEIGKLNLTKVKEMEVNRKYFLYFKSNNWEENLNVFLSQIKPVIDNIIISYGLENEFFFTEEKFERNIKRIESIKEKKTPIVPDLPNSAPKKRDKTPIAYPLNQILYGPPGTGKTYQTIELAYNIASDEDEEEEVSYAQARHWWKTELAKKEDRQLDFITFHQNYSYEDFVMGIKPDLLGAGLVFKEHKGIFFEICQRALANLKQSKADDTVTDPSFESVLEEFLRPLTEEDETIVLPMKMPGKTFEITKRNDKNLEFTNASGGTSHQLTFKTIKELYLGNRENDLQGLKSYYDPLVKHLKGIANSKKKVTLKNYVLVIDEINRANISRVFGELITLIEDDKRWGNEHEMEVLLPDNKTKFAIPKNLHIIGTMNTADKSIALLDVALRRRFIFKGIFPNKNEVKEEFREFFETLNEKIVEKKGNDFTIGHAFFHKEKNFDFVEVMNYKVIPLLNEYFYNARSFEVVKKLLNDSLKKIKVNNFEVNQDGFQLVISERNEKD